MDISSVPPAPRMVSETARDLIFKYRGTQKAMLWVGVAFLIVSIISIAVFLPFSMADIVLDLGIGKQQTPGEITNVSLSSSLTINEQPATEIHYNYQVDGDTYSQYINTIDNDLIAAQEIGNRFSIEYSTLNPLWSRLEGEPHSSIPYYFILPFLSIFFIIGLLCTIFAIRGNRREIRAYTNGMPIIADVTYEGFDESATINGRHPYAIEWSFNVNGTDYKGHLSNMNKTKLKDISGKEQLIALYDPSQPQTNTVYIP